MTIELQNLLAMVVRDSRRHAAWLNTFSYMEYIGFRKIVKSQDAGELSLETLTHAVEEGRHALRLKKMAIREGGPAFDRYADETMLAKRAAEDYFQTLDRACENALKGLPAREAGRLAYLYVTWLVEVRALEVYRAYQEAAPELALKGLIEEETLHLKAVAAELKDRDPRFEAHLQELRALEGALANAYLQAVAREIGLAMEASFVEA